LNKGEIIEPPTGKENNLKVNETYLYTGMIKSKIAIEVIKSFLIFLIEDIKLVNLMLLEYKFQHLKK